MPRPQMMIWLIALAGWVMIPTYGRAEGDEPKKSTVEEKDESVTDDGLQTATFGGGCFWCVEAVFENVRGVKDVVSGYEGGRIKNPNYKQVCTGRTGHAEVCQVKFDPQVISFPELLEIFWKTHDPTTLNRQGNDIGTQYRSVIFYHSVEQQELAEKYLKKLDESGAFSDKIVTVIAPTEIFYPAEDYHQDFYRNNPNNGYCNAFARPKIEKLKAVFADKYEPAK